VSGGHKCALPICIPFAQHRSPSLRHYFLKVHFPTIMCHFTSNHTVNESMTYFLLDFQWIRMDSSSYESTLHGLLSNFSFNLLKYLVNFLVTINRYEMTLFFIKIQ